MRQSGHIQWQAGQPFMEIMRRGLALHRGRQRQNHLAHILTGAGDQPLDVQLRRAAPVNGAQGAAKNMIKATENSGTFHCPQITDILDNTDHLSVTLGIGAQGADVAGVEIAAIGTVAHRAANRAKVVGKRQHQRFAVLQKMQDGAAGRSWAKPGKPRQPANQRIKFGIHDGAPLRTGATCRAAAADRR